MTAPRSPVPFTSVKIDDSLWSPRQKVNAEVCLLHSLQMLESAGNIRNFERAARQERDGYEGPVYMDSDLYKALEAISYSLATHPNPELQSATDEIVEKIARAQMPDGYLNTYFQVHGVNRRWTNLHDHHELYCAGHLIEAAIAHRAATGQNTLFAVAVRFADLIDDIFRSGGRPGYPGHPEIELALVKLYKATGNRRYFDLAKHFIDARGAKFFATEHGIPPDEFDGSYWQDEVPVRELQTMVGHSVRVAYLLCGVADVVAVEEYPELLAMLDRVWTNTVERRMYVTGGIGSSKENEGFTEDFDLPDLTAYQETCASVAMAMLHHRMFLLHGESKYADMLERVLYNGVLVGASLDGKTFFYSNPLASNGDHHRSDWFKTACCPPNYARTIAALGGYAYATSDTALWVNLYVAGTFTTVIGGIVTEWRVSTDYPWSGTGSLELLSGEGDFSVFLRIPGWCKSYAVNGESLPLERGYVVLRRTWAAGDTITFNLEMPAELLPGHEKVHPCDVAITRGPLIYCVEAADNSGGFTTVPPTDPLEVSWDEHLLGGVIVIRTPTMTAVPYYAWDNRAPGTMRVWHPTG